jgi:hypothetical protein
MSLRAVNWIRAGLMWAVCAAWAVPAIAAPAPRQSKFVQALDQMMSALGAESARSSVTMRRVYEEYLDVLMLEAYTDLEGALDNGGLVPLPSDPERFNLLPRLDGPNPIGEKDLDNQSSYVAARPSTIGALLEIASRVKSGPVEITSLVRHSHYQDALRATNVNANTAVPTHTLGLAFDIGVVNSSLKTVFEIRDVLQKMQRAGDILFVAERRQLVFHVVPHPSRLGHFADVYAKKVGPPSTSRFTEVVAAAPAPKPRRRGPLKPSVTSEVLAVLPATGTAADWPPTPLDEHAGPVTSTAGPALEKAASPPRAMFSRLAVLFLALIAATWRIAAPPRVRPSLFERA